MPDDYFAQLQYRVRLEWGRDGAKRAADRGDILVIVDVLRFSTTVVSILRHEGTVAPCAWEDDPFAFAEKVGGEVATSRKDAPAPSRFSLSPRSYADLEPGTRIVLPSPNGATCSRLGVDVPYLFAGAFVNARTIAHVVRRILHLKPHCLTVVACGERWEEPGEDGTLRFAMEDYLGAGAILSHLDMGMSPEAEVCTQAFLGLADNLKPLLLRCGSGLELNVRDAWEDVIFAAQSDICPIAPVLRDGWFVPLARRISRLNLYVCLGVDIMPDIPYHQSLRLKNFTVFEDNEFEFVPGINIFVGENGTGKTHLMKALYAAQLTKARQLKSIAETLGGLFQTNNLAQLVRLGTSPDTFADVRGQYGEQKWRFTILRGEEVDWAASETPLQKAERPVFIPALDMMGHTRGFLQAASEVVLDFDLTCSDLVSLLGLQRRKREHYQGIATTLAELLNGKIEYDENDNRFYLVTPLGRMPMPLVAEGIRRIATLVRLLQNGWIVPGTTLFWDEPEVNLNPILMDEVVSAILGLARQGVQVFLATHSYVILRELEVQSRKSDSLRYFALSRTERGVSAHPASNYLDIEPNPIERQYADLYDRSIAKRLGGEAD